MNNETTTTTPKIFRECECEHCVKYGSKLRTDFCIIYRDTEEKYIKDLINIKNPIIDCTYYNQFFELTFSKKEQSEMFYKNPGYGDFLKRLLDGHGPIKYVRLNVKNGSGYFKGDYCTFLLDVETDIKFNITSDYDYCDKIPITKYQRICLYPGSNYILLISEFTKSERTYFERDYYRNPCYYIENVVYRYGEEEYVDPNRFSKTKSSRFL